MFAQVMTVYPETSEKWLASSKGNRKINWGRVAQYADAMKRGEFTLNDSAICFDGEGHLLNGHHRAHACIMAGVPFDAFVVFGMPSDAIMDRGLPRSTGDALYMAGKLNKDLSDARVISAARAYMSVINDTTSRYDMRICDFVNEHAAQISEAIRISGLGKDHGICIKAGCRAAFIAALNMGVPAERIEKFAIVVNTGMPENPSQYAAIVLRNYMLGITQRGRASIKKLCAITQLSLRDFIAGMPRKQAYKKLSYPYMPELKESASKANDKL